MKLKLRSFTQFLILSIFLSISLLINYKTVCGQYRFENWTTDNGLPQNGIRQIAQTPDGYLWFTTFDGLVRFDGINFTTFGKGNTKGIYNSRFATLYCDKDGTLFAGTTNEVGSLTIYKNGEFFSYSPDQVPGTFIVRINSDENGETRFLIIEDDKNTTNWYKLQNDKFVLSEALDNQNYVFRYWGKSGTLWTITPTKIVEKKNNIETIYEHLTIGSDLPREGFEDSDGGFWIGRRELIRLKDGKIQYFRQFPHYSEFHSFWEEDDKSLWFATGGNQGIGIGLVRYHNGKFSVFGEKEGLSDPSIFHMFKDREETIWLATNRGLNRLRKSVITTISTNEGLVSPEVNPLFRDSNNDIWIGTTKGINIYRNGKVITPDFEFPPNQKLDFNNYLLYTQSFAEDSTGKIWFGTTNGILIKDGKKLSIINKTEPYSVFSIYQESNGLVWAASNKGILLFEDYQLKKIYTKANGLLNDFVISIFKDSKGSLWFGTFGGLVEFKNDQFKTYTTDDGLAGNTIRTIYEDKTGTLWIGTYDEGLSRYKNGKFTSYKSTDGLYNNGVFAIQEDNKGNFWISSNVGIYRVKIDELNAFAEGKIEKFKSVGYGKDDGMLNSECNGGRQPASIKDQNGHIWFPTQDGVVIINPEIETDNLFPPKVVIEAATVEREPIDINEKIIIEPGKRNIEINYTGISFIKSNQIRFKYILEGHDSNWVEAETRRSAFYSYLPPGEYKFKVIAANSDGVWNNEGAVITLEVKPFFYQTNLFNFIIIAIIGIILIIAWRISIFRFRERERELAQLVNEKTNELRQANEELQTLATSDQLTQVGNRRFFEENLEKEWNRAARSKKPLSLILIDVDYFKIFNDTYGHQLGDKCLKQIAASLKKSIKRPTDSVSRYGGEEFAVILGDTDAKGALHIANLIQKNVFELDITHEKSLASKRITVSIGVTTINSVTKNTSQTELITSADQALYKAKENGRDQIISKEI